MGNIFSANAQFGGIAQGPLRLTRFVHQTLIEVDENPASPVNCEF